MVLVLMLLAGWTCALVAVVALCVSSAQGDRADVRRVAAARAARHRHACGPRRGARTGSGPRRIQA